MAVAPYASSTIVTSSPNISNKLEIRKKQNLHISNLKMNGKREMTYHM